MGPIVQQYRLTDPFDTQSLEAINPVTGSDAVQMSDRENESATEAIRSLEKNIEKIQEHIQHTEQASSQLLLDILLHNAIGYYGVQWDTTNPSTALTRVGNMSLHSSLPIQSGMRRCLLRDDGTVNYYLHPYDSTLKEDGTPAILDGSHGQVMVEIPSHYRKFETQGTTARCLLSKYPLSGFHLVPLCYRSAYEAAIDRTSTSSPKLASVVNSSAAFRGGANTAEWDGTYRSLLGMPGSSISLNNFRVYARRRGSAGLNGAGWNCDLYDVQKACYWLYVVEYADLNSQLAFNPEPTGEGFKQGGLGTGVTGLGKNWDVYNAYNPIIPCGYTNSLGNATGQILFTLPEEYPISLAKYVPSYRGLENPFGHLWSITDGCKCRLQSEAEGGLSEFYVCNDPAKYQSTDYSNYELRGTIPRTTGYVSRIMFGELGDNMSAESGGSHVTYFTDLFYTSIPTSGEVERCLLCAGAGQDPTPQAAGLSTMQTTITPSGWQPYFGSRLCFLPQDSASR